MDVKSIMATNSNKATTADYVPPTLPILRKSPKEKKEATPHMIAYIKLTQVDIWSETRLWEILEVDVINGRKMHEAKKQ